MSELVGPLGKVLAFEPMLSTAGYLAQTRLLNELSQLTVFPLGLGGPRDGFEIRRLPTVRGMIDSTLQGKEWKETVLVVQLDWFWPTTCGRDTRIDGIKIDVQGMELEVLSGMVELLRRFRPELVVEFHSGVDRFDLLKLIKSLGYNPVAVPIEPAEGEIEAKFHDDRSYAFRKI